MYHLAPQATFMQLMLFLSILCTAMRYTMPIEVPKLMSVCVLILIKATATTTTWAVANNKSCLILLQYFDERTKFATCRKYMGRMINAPGHTYYVYAPCHNRKIHMTRAAYSVFMCASLILFIFGWLNHKIKPPTKGMLDFQIPCWSFVCIFWLVCIIG